MTATQFERQFIGAKKLETRSSWLRKVLGLSAASTLIELGTTLAGDDCNAQKCVPCSRCKAPRRSQCSGGQYPNVFCSKECEQEFIRAALASLTVEECISIQHRLETLVMGAREIELKTKT